jgi:ribokinase
MSGRGMSERPHIVVVGSIMADMTVWLDRVPAAGETLVGRSFRLGFGGKGANQAAMAALMGARVSMVACVGGDSFGSDAIANLGTLGIDAAGVAVLPEQATGVAPIWVDENGENRIVIVPGANSLMSTDQVDAALDPADPPDVVICQLEIPLACVRHALQRGREQGAVTILNPAPFLDEAAELLGLADWVVPNEIEFEALARILLGADAPAPASLADGLPRIAAMLGASVLVTCGERGALLCRAGEDGVQEIPAARVEVIDTSGAGDAFVGAFARALAGGASAAAAAESAVRCASLTVGLPGTQASFASSAARLSQADGADGRATAAASEGAGDGGAGGR